MSERKESLLRTLKLQHEQLEQWEQKRSLHNDPDEKMRCEVKIKDIKALIAENEMELRKMKGGKPQQGMPNTSPQTVQPRTYTKIGFNADKEYSANRSHDNVTGSAVDLPGDEYNIDEIHINPPTNTTIVSPGNSVPLAGENNSYDLPEDQNYVTHQVIDINKSFHWENNLSVIGAIFLAAGICVCSIFIKDRHMPDLVLNNGSVQFVALFLSLILVWIIYRFSPITQGLKFSFSVLILCAYAAFIFWRVEIFGSEENNNEKTVGEVIILPLLIVTIGSIVVLINEENKKKSK